MNIEILNILYEICSGRQSIHANGHCIVYNGPTQNGYGIIRKSIYGVRYQIYAHQVAALHYNGLVEVPEGVECSHLCHNRLCINGKHISFEPHFINNQRNNCKSEQRCVHHVNAPDCIFI